MHRLDNTLLLVRAARNVRVQVSCQELTSWYLPDFSLNFYVRDVLENFCRFQKKPNNRPVPVPKCCLLLCTASLPVNTRGVMLLPSPCVPMSSCRDFSVFIRQCSLVSPLIADFQQCQKSLLPLIRKSLTCHSLLLLIKVIHMLIKSHVCQHVRTQESIHRI